MAPRRDKPLPTASAPSTSSSRPPKPASPATVAVVEPTGSETQLFVRFGDTELVAVFRDRHHFEPGQTIHLKPHATRSHLFDAATGARV
ncbi:MAG: TOBE domain-containing protein [Hyphomicrobium sp.]